MGVRGVRGAWSAIVVLLTAQPALASDILVNGGFEGVPLGTGWTQVLADANDPLIVTGGDLPPFASPQSGGSLAWLGGILSSADAIYQDVNVPAGANKLTLNGYVWIQSEEPFLGVYDHFYAEVLTPGNVLLEVLHHWANYDHNRSWVPFSLQSTGNYAGSLIRLRFRSSNDDFYVTNFLIDTCVLDASTAVAVGPTALPAVSRLSAARPNPTRGNSRFRLDLSAPGVVHAGIYDLEGRLVRRIADESFAAGSHDLTWDGIGVAGRRAASGVYICVADIDGRPFRQRVALIH